MREKKKRTRKRRRRKEELEKGRRRTQRERARERDRERVEVRRASATFVLWLVLLACIRQSAFPAFPSPFLSWIGGAQCSPDSPQDELALHSIAIVTTLSGFGFICSCVSLPLSRFVVVFRLCLGVCKFLVRRGSSPCCLTWD